MPFSAPLIPENGLSSGSNQEEEAQAPPPRRHRKSVFVGANGNPYSNDLRDGGSGYNSSEDDVDVENGDIPKLPPLNDASGQTTFSFGAQAVPTSVQTPFPGFQTLGVRCNVTGAPDGVLSIYLASTLHP